MKLFARHQHLYKPLKALDPASRRQLSHSQAHVSAAPLGRLVIVVEVHPQLGIDLVPPAAHVAARPGLAGW